VIIILLYFFGNGKGKTTAGLGNLVRAKLHNKKVLLVHALKNATVESELFDTFCFGSPGFIYDEPKKEHFKLAEDAFKLIKEKSKDYDVIMFDELGMLLHYGLIDIDKVILFLEQFVGEGYPVFIVTGRVCIVELEELADLVSEIKEIKHPYQKGIKALQGIDF